MGCGCGCGCGLRQHAPPCAPLAPHSTAHCDAEGGAAAAAAAATVAVAARSPLRICGALGCGCGGDGGGRKPPPPCASNAAHRGAGGGEARLGCGSPLGCGLWRRLTWGRPSAACEQRRRPAAPASTAQPMQAQVQAPEAAGSHLRPSTAAAAAAATFVRNPAAICFVMVAMVPTRASHPRQAITGQEPRMAHRTSRMAHGASHVCASHRAPIQPERGRAGLLISSPSQRCVHFL